MGDVPISYLLTLASAGIFLTISAPMPVLKGPEAIRCRAAAEALRDQAYDEMRLLVVRVERSPNLSLKALTDVETEILRRETEISQLEVQADKFAFAAEPTPAVRIAHKEMTPVELKPQVATCVERLPAAPKP
ncbi:MAG: hypothetical protein QM645_14295 [Asticcacaulis sp.]